MAEFEAFGMSLTFNGVAVPLAGPISVSLPPADQTPNVACYGGPVSITCEWSGEDAYINHALLDHRFGEPDAYRMADWPLPSSDALNEAIRGVVGWPWHRVARVIRFGEPKA